MIIFYRNHGNSKINDVASVVTDTGECLTVLSNSMLSKDLLPNEVQKQTLQLLYASTCPCSPGLLISYRTDETGHRCSIGITLPIIACSFMMPLSMTLEDYNGRWDTLGDSRHELSQVFHVPPDFNPFVLLAILEDVIVCPCM